MDGTVGVAERTRLSESMRCVLDELADKDSTPGRKRSTGGGSEKRPDVETQMLRLWKRRPIWVPLECPGGLAGT